MTASVDTVTGGELDLARMRRDRAARLRQAMADQDVAAVLLIGGANVRYATGAGFPGADSARLAHTAPVAFLRAGDDHPHLFTAFPEAAPPELPEDHLHGPVDLESDAGVAEFAKRLHDVTGGDLDGRVGVDELTAPLFFGLRDVLPDAEPIDGAPVASAARIVKTPDEVECVHRAQRINELAMYEARAALRPGARQHDLTSVFLRRVFELGASGTGIDPIWQVMPANVAAGPYSVTGDVVFPTPPADQMFREGDVVWVDSGISVEGYQSDFGRTWIVGRDPTSAQRDQFRRWKAVVERVLEEVRPGATGADLTAAAHEVESDTPWPSYFYLAHGVGLNSAEMPLIGTDLGPEFDAGLVLAPGMILVFEPAIWDDDGTGGYRSEEIVVVTDDGYRQLSNHPYEPYA